MKCSVVVSEAVLWYNANLTVVQYIILQYSNLVAYGVAKLNKTILDNYQYHCYVIAEIG